MGSFQAIDPDVNRLLQFLGVIENGNLNSDWLENPLEELKQSMSDADRRQILLDLFSDLVDTSDAQIEGIPGENGDETWYAIPDVEPVKLYITTKPVAEGMVLGIAIKWQHSHQGMQAKAWVSLPMLLLSNSASPVVFAPTALNVPVVIGFSASDATGFGDPEGVSFKGCELNANIFLTAPSADLHITLRDFKFTPEQTAEDLDLGALDNIDFQQLQRLVTALVSARIRQSGATGERIVKELFPLLGLSGERIIDWSQVASEGVDVLKQWFADLLRDGQALIRWLQHAYRLLVDETADAAADWSALITGSGTRPNPYCMRVNPIAQDVSIFVTLASVSTANGEVVLYPGLKFASDPVVISANSDTSFGVESRAELFAVSLNGGAVFELLTDFSAQCRVFKPSGFLVSHDFQNDPDLAFLGNYSVKEWRFGLRYDPDNKFQPSCELIDVRATAGSWPVVNLLNGDEVLNDVQSIGENIVQQAIRDLFQLDSSADHPAKHLAALMGLVAPAEFNSTWPVTLNTNLDRIGLFLSQPLAAVASYHSACIELADSSDNNHWFYMLSELVQLFGWQNKSRSGHGTVESPWQITLFEQAANGRSDKLHLAFSTDAAGERPLLGVHWLIEPHRLSLSDSLELHSNIQADALQLVLPPAADPSVGTQAECMTGAQARLSLRGHSNQGAANTPIVLETPLGLRFSADEVVLLASWLRQPSEQEKGFDWQLSVKQFEAHWQAMTEESIALPSIDFGGGNNLVWDFNNLPNGLDLPTLSRLLRLCIGSWLIQRGGSFGFGIACLFGFLPEGGLELNFPDVELELDWQNSPFGFPQGNGGEIDWPVFEPNDWSLFFDNPWPELWGHFKLLLASPQWSLPSIRLLGGLFSGALPNLNMPNLGLESNGAGSFAIPEMADLPFSVSGEGTYESPWVLRLAKPEDKPIELLFWLDPDGPVGFDLNAVAKSLLPEEWQDLAALVSNEGFTVRNLGSVLYTLASLVPPLAGPMASISRQGVEDGLVAAQAMINTTDGVVLEQAQLSGGAVANWTDQLISPAVNCDHFTQLQDADLLSTVVNAVQSVPGNLPVLCLGAAWESTDTWLATQSALGLGGAEDLVHLDMRELGVDPAQIGLADITAAANSRFFVGDIAVFNTAPSLDERAIPIIGLQPEDSSQVNQLQLMVQRIQEITNQSQVIIVAHSHAALPAVALQQRADGNAVDSGIASIVTVGAPLRGASIFSGIDDAARKALAEGLGFLNGMLGSTVAEITAPVMIKNAIDYLYQCLQGRLDIPAIVNGAFPEHAFDPLNNLNVSIPCTAIASSLPKVELKLILLPWLQTEMSQRYAERRVPTHLGYGVQFTSEHSGGDKLQLKQRTRIDIGRLALPAANDEDAALYQALPRLRVFADIKREDGWLVGGVSENPRLRWAQFSISVDAERTVPDIVLHDAFLDGIALAKTSLRDVLRLRGNQSQQSGGHAFDPEALLQRLLGELTDVIEDLPRLTCLAECLNHFGLMQKMSLPAVGNNPPMEFWIFRFEGWQQFLNDSEGYLQNQIAEIIASDQRRSDLLATLNSCFNFNVFPLNLLSQSNSDGTAIQLKPLIKILQALRLLLESDNPLTGPFPGDLPECFPQPENIRSLLCEPKAYLEKLLKEVVGKQNIVDRLRSQINRELGLNRIAKPEETLALGGHFTLRCNSEGVYQLCFELTEADLGIELTAKLCFVVDLAQQQVSARLTLCPTAIGLELAFTATYALDGIENALNRTINDADLTESYGIAIGLCGELAYPDFELPVYPVPDAEELRNTFEKTLPRFLLNSIVSELCERHIFNSPSNQALADFIECLGLSYRRNGGKLRLRSLDGLLEDPVRWLKQPLLLGHENVCVDTAAVVALFNCFAKALELTDAQGRIVLAGGLLLSCDQHHGARFRLLSPNQGLNFGDDVQLAFGLAVTLRETCEIAASLNGDVQLDVDLSGNELGVGLAFELDAENQRVSLRHSLDNSSNTIALYPFGGWQSLLQFGADEALKLLNTLLKAAMNSLAQEDAELAEFVQQLRNIANALGLNDAQSLEDLYNNPREWLQNRINDDANGIWQAAVSAFNTLLQNLQANLPLTAANTKLCYHYPSANTPTLSVCVGIESGDLGIWLSLNDYELDPIQVNSNLGITTPVAQLNNIVVTSAFSLDLTSIDPVVNIAGIDVNPSLALRLHSQPNANDHYCRLHPFGVDFPSTLYLELFPTTGFVSDPDSLLVLVETVVMPSLLEMLLDTEAVTELLKRDLGGGFKLGSALTDCELLENDNGNGFNLKFPYDDLDAKQLLLSLLRSVINTLISTGNSHLADGKIEVVRLDQGAASHWGIRIALDGLSLKDDPELALNIGSGDASWIERSGGTSATEGGLYFYLPYKASSNADFSLLPRVDCVNLGMAVSGKNDQALMDLGFASLNGFDFKTFVSLVLDGNTAPQFGASVEIDQLGISMGGAASGSGVARNLLGSDTGDGGDESKVNPAFSIELSYVNDLDVRLSGQAANQSEIWFPIQKTMGPVHVSQLGVRWHDSERAVEMLLDGGVSLAGLNVTVDDLGLKVPIATFDQLDTWSIGLRGLGVSYNKGGIKVSGALLQTDAQGNEYSGACLVQAGGKTFTAIGAYSKNPETSMFVFVLLPLPIGGPPFLFITGMAGGFGYNRGLNVPSIDAVNDFPLVQAALGSGGFSSDPMNALQKLGSAVPVKSGAYWLAGGIRFTSFELAKSVALAYVLLDRGLEIGLLGLTQMKLPESNPLVNLEMALKARFSSADGLISVEARLTDNSWLLSDDCRLTGGFAFYLWFAGAHKSDFVITLGGYHPKFAVPKHYPEVPRLGFNWRVTSKVTIKGESYFALTSAAVMAGGLLEASYKSGNLKAWFKAWADFLIQWKPFFYNIGIGVSVGVSYRLKVNLLFGTVTKTFKAELGADLEIEGPKFGGKATINWWVISFTVKFGSQGGPDRDALKWSAFASGFLPSPDEIHGADVVSGVIPQEGADPETSDMVLQTEFIIGTETVMGTNRVNLFGSTELDIYDAIDIRPMALADVDSTHKVSLSRVSPQSSEAVVGRKLSSEGDTHVFRTDTNGLLTIEVKRGRVPFALWGELNSDGSTDAKAEAKLVDSITGVNIIAEVAIADNHTGEIPVMDLVESATLPLPFAIEREQRHTIQALVTQAAGVQFSEDSATIFKAASLVLGQQWRPHREGFLAQVDDLGANVALATSGSATAEQLSRDAVAPPQLGSRYDNMGGETFADSRDEQPQGSGSNSGTGGIGGIEIGPVLLIPRLWAVLRRPIVVKPEIVEPIATTVAGVLPDRTPVRIDVSNYRGYNAKDDLRRRAIDSKAPYEHISRSGAYATLTRVSATQGQVGAVIGGSGQAFILDAKATAGLRNDAKVIEQRAFSRNLGALSATRKTKKKPVAQGNLVAAGTTQIWTLPTKNTEGEIPKVWFRGDQALRLTAFDRAGAMLEDWESTRKLGVWQLPKGTARVAVTGLGGNSQLSRKPNGAGAASRQISRSGKPVYGWQQSSELVPISARSYLARAAVVTRLEQASALERSQGKGLVSAAKIIRQAKGLSTALPLDSEVVIVQLSRASHAVGDILESVRIGSNSSNLMEEPLIVESGGIVSLIYSQKSRSPFALFTNKSSLKTATTKSLANKSILPNQPKSLNIECVVSNGWQLVGVIGGHGSANDWQQQLQQTGPHQIVDDGLLGATGQSMVQFKIDPAISKKVEKQIKNEATKLPKRK